MSVCCSYGHVYCFSHQGRTYTYTYDTRGFSESYDIANKCANCHGVEERAKLEKSTAEHVKYVQAQAEERDHCKILLTR